MRTTSTMIDRKKFLAYVRLIRFNRPIGTLLLLWPTLWALWIAAGGKPDTVIVAVFLLGVVLMRSAGCIINDYADRHVDPHVKRTATRPLATGEITPREALTLFSILSLTALGLVCLMNMLTIQLSVIAMILAVTYPYMKRYTHLPQIHLGMAFGWAVPMSFAAQTESVPMIGWLLFLNVVVWAVVYDTMYAMIDRDDDIRIGVKSTAVLFGNAELLWVGFFQIVFCLLLILIGVYAFLSFYYFTGVGLAIGFSIYHQYLIRHRNRDACLAAFLSNNWIGAVVFAGIVAHYAFISHPE